MQSGRVLGYTGTMSNAKSYAIVHEDVDYGRGNTSYGPTTIIAVYPDLPTAKAALEAIGYGRIEEVINPIIKAGKAFMPR